MASQVLFENPKFFREWLKKHHRTVPVLWVCYYKKHTKKASITWDESVAEALCFGWIDGLRRSIDDESYKIRFTPRKKTSIWSKKNIDTVDRLIKQKRMLKEGMIAFEHRQENKSAIYSYEKPKLELSREYTDALRVQKTVWDNYNKLTPSVIKQSINWVMSAIKQETRDRRFGIFLDSCSSDEVIPALRWTNKDKKG